MCNVVRALFVAWQNPTTRRFYPVGRLAEIEGDECQACFEFVYIQAARDAEGFQPFLAFPDFYQAYRAKELFPLFDNRLLSRKRPDYPEYMAQMGLPPATTSPLIILSRSTGRRVTDTLELFPLPEFEEGCGYRTWFWAHGLRYLTLEGQQRLLRLIPDEGNRSQVGVGVWLIFRPEGHPSGGGKNKPVEGRTNKFAWPLHLSNELRSTRER